MKKYNPGDKEKETIKSVYNELEYMRKLRNQKWKYFNDRTLKEYIDDSQLRLNGFVPSKASQGKEKWQSNVFHPITRNKFKAMIAAIALDVPQIKIVAQNEKQQQDQDRALIMRNLVDYSYDQDNKEEQIFFEAWESAEKGTVIVYDGYLKAKQKRKIISSYDPQTGEVEFEEQEVETDSQCVNFIVPLMNLYIKDFNIYDIQKQPSLCWVERMDADQFKNEFEKYDKYEYVKTSNELTDPNEADTFFKAFWQECDKDDEPIEVVRYFNKGKDEFRIIANGVLLFESPLILGKKKKWYPFAKTVFEPLATDFFYGNSLPNSLMGEQDVINALYNMALDKTYKSLVPPLLIGNINKDDFDLEDQNITSDTRIYVQDISQVLPMPIKGVEQSEFKMIEMISRGLDLTSIDANQQGIANRGVTAREVVIANENAKKLKGSLYLFLNSLWIQKIKLRIMNILTYYTQIKVDKALGEKGQGFQQFMVNNSELSMGKGTMAIEMYGSKNEMPTPAMLDVKEQQMQKQSGNNYEIIAITNDYLDDWQFDIKIESESLYQKESGLTQAKVEDKLRMLGTYSPQTIMNNQEKVTKDILIAYEDDPDDYNLTPPMAQPGMAGAPAGEGEATATAGQTGLPPLPPA
jgi:hypothetical protein